MARLTRKKVEALTGFVVEVVRELCPDVLKPTLSITNGSTAYKLSVRVSVAGSGILYASTIGDRFYVAAGGSVPLDKTSIRTELTEALTERFAHAEARWRLNEPLLSIPGVYATQDKSGISLTFDGLTPEAYARITKALIPLMHVPRYDREEPL